MTKTRSSEIFGVQMEIIFLKERHSEIFSVPLNSAPGLRL